MDWFDEGSGQAEDWKTFHDILIVCFWKADYVYSNDKRHHNMCGTILEFNQYDAFEGHSDAVGRFLNLFLRQRLR